METLCRGSHCLPNLLFFRRSVNLEEARCMYGCHWTGTTVVNNCTPTELLSASGRGVPQHPPRTRDSHG
eukprot:8867917-Lingulodinium_polyedra.AAC.1